MKIELERDSWLGRELNHPTNVCSLVWGIVCTGAFYSFTAVVITLCVLGALGFLYLLFHANVYLGRLFFGDLTLLTAEASKIVGSLMVDVIAVILLSTTTFRVVFSEVLEIAIQPHWQRLSAYVIDKCPEVVWVEKNKE